jgi:hypothetical protein
VNEKLQVAEKDKVLQFQKQKNESKREPKETITIFQLD